MGPTLAERQAAAKAEYDNWLSSFAVPFDELPFGGQRQRRADQMSMKRTELEKKHNVPHFRKGGIADFQGLAMLHGSKSSPEAVLSASQTQMFMGLRDALEKVAVDSNSTGGVNIENISISTASLNNNQDFKRAGETLADAFKNAIQRKGVTINTNKI